MGAYISDGDGFALRVLCDRDRVSQNLEGNSAQVETEVRGKRTACRYAFNTDRVSS